MPNICPSAVSCVSLTNGFDFCNILLEDIIMALARTRIKIEGLLRKALDKRNDVSGMSNTNIKFLGLNSLFQKYVQIKPVFKKFLKVKLTKPFLCSGIHFFQDFTEFS